MTIKNWINSQTFSQKFGVGPYMAYFAHNFCFVAAWKNVCVHDNDSVNFAQKVSSVGNENPCFPR